MIPGTLDLTMYRGATFGPVNLQCKQTVNNVLVPVDLTDYVPEAQVRAAPKKPLVLDLGPTIPVPSNGTILIYFTDEQTKVIAVYGDFVWDLFLINPSGERLGPFLAGAFYIKDSVTKD